MKVKLKFHTSWLLSSIQSIYMYCMWHMYGVLMVHVHGCSFQKHEVYYTCWRVRFGLELEVLRTQKLHKLTWIDVVRFRFGGLDYNTAPSQSKALNKIRISNNLWQLNKAMQQEYYPLLTMKEVVSRHPQAKYFSIFNAASGVWQILLNQTSSYLTYDYYMFNHFPFHI